MEPKEKQLLKKKEITNKEFIHFFKFVIAKNLKLSISNDWRIMDISNTKNHYIEIFMDYDFKKVMNEFKKYPNIKKQILTKETEKKTYYIILNPNVNKKMGGYILVKINNRDDLGEYDFVLDHTSMKEIYGAYIVNYEADFEEFTSLRKYDACYITIIDGRSYIEKATIHSGKNKYGSHKHYITEDEFQEYL